MCEIDMNIRTGKVIVCYSKLISLKCSSTETHGANGVATNCLLAISMSQSGHQRVHVGTGSHTNGSLTSSSLNSTSRELIYTDLYVDVVVRDDYSVFTKDHEVFDRAALRYPIVEESRQKAFEALNWVEEHAKNWTGPFSDIPQHLPRTDWETLTTPEIYTSMHAALNGHGENDTR
jgi:hypothetical protein